MMTNFKATRNFHKLSYSFYLFLTIVISVSDSYGQVKFENGYFIDNDNHKIECLIKNYEWKNNPNKIEYKLLDSNTSVTLDIMNIQEFQVSNLKYRRFTIDIDQSGNSLSNISTEKEPNYKEETILLKCIIEGCASLYKSDKHKKYFYENRESVIVQLVHKEYLSENRVLTNNLYKAQLSSDLKCSSITYLDIANTKYNLQDLRKIFIKYNNCINCSFTDFSIKERRDAFNLSIRPGIQRSILSIRNSQNNSQNIDFPSDIRFRIGIEAEFLFAFNKNKWALIIEPTYQSYRSKDPRQNFSNDVDYKSIEFPIGLRYYMFLNDHSKLFLSTSFILLDVPINSSIGHLEIKSTNNIRFGLGYSYKKLSGEIIYSTRREILSSYTFYKSKYRYISIVVGYSIF